MVELVDTPDLGSGAARRGGSSPLTRTKVKGFVPLVKQSIKWCPEIEGWSYGPPLQCITAPSVHH